MITKGHDLANREIAAAYAGMAAGAAMPDWFHRLVLALRPVRAGETVLDLGCGPAGTLCHAPAPPAGSRYFGLDLCRPGRDDGGSVVARIVGEAQNLPFRPASFDLIYLTEVIEHNADPERVLRQARAMLKPGGELVLTVPNASAYFPLLFWYRRLSRHPFWQYLLPCEYPTRSNQPIDTVLSYGEIMRLVRAGGFRPRRAYGGEPLKYVHDLFKVRGDEKNMLRAERWLERLEKLLTRAGLARCCYRLYLVCGQR